LVKVFDADKGWVFEAGGIGPGRCRDGEEEYNGD
jgi:hypothetical protein